MDTVLDNMLTNRDDLAHDIRTVLGPIVLKRNHFLSSDFKSNLRIDRNGHIVVGDEWDTPADVRAETAKMKKRISGLGQDGNWKQSVPCCKIPILTWCSFIIPQTGLWKRKTKIF